MVKYIWVWGAMALVQSMKPQPAFKKFVEAVLQILIRNEGSTNSKFVHFVSDQYLENYIKNIEWNRRGANEFHEMKIYKQDQSISQWFKYVSTGSKIGFSVVLEIERLNDGLNENFVARLKMGFNF